MNAAQYRANLEKEKDKLMRMLDSRETAMRGMVAKHLRSLVEEINLLDSGESWTQEPSDTKARIVIADLASNRRTMR
jgi:hypothetical protein